jgi:hypothetical protein
MPHTTDVHRLGDQVWFTERGSSHCSVSLVNLTYRPIRRSKSISGQAQGYTDLLGILAYIYSESGIGISAHHDRL